MSLFDENRLRVYLGGLAVNSEVESKHAYTDGLVACGAMESKLHVLYRYGWSEQIRRNYNNYVREAQELVRLVSPEAVFLVFAGDTRSRFEQPVFTKSRMIDDNDAAMVLLPLDRIRHWNDFGRVNEVDIPYFKKDNKLVWRGLTTGSFASNGFDTKRGSRSYIPDISSACPDFDVGYSKVVQVTSECSQVPLPILRKHLRPAMSIGEQLNSKFLLSLEGNDVATGLKWMLYSNSTVIMPTPSCETWACESLLEPFVHYVPVKDDLSDIDTVYDWCLSHKAECAEIAHAGRMFMTEFFDEDREMEICRSVIRAYLQHSDLEVDPMFFEGVRQTVLKSLLRFQSPKVVRPDFPK